MTTRELQYSICSMWILVGRNQDTYLVFLFKQFVRWATFEMMAQNGRHNSVQPTTAQPLGFGSVSERRDAGIPDIQGSNWSEENKHPDTVLP